MNTSNSVIPYQFESNEVRIILDHNGDSCIIATDLAKPLGLRNIRQNLASLDDDEKGVCTVYTPGGEQQLAYVTEPGLYRLIFASRKEEAKRFKRWVYHEVLTSIHHQGGYISPDATTEQLEALRAELNKAKRELSDAHQVNYWLGGRLGAGKFIENSLPDSDRD